jgi:hypothetical protein
MIESLVFGVDEYRHTNRSVIALHPPGSSPLGDGKVPTQPSGLIGSDILSHYDVEYDPRAHRIRLYRPHPCNGGKPIWQGVFFKMQVTLSQRQDILVPVSLNNLPVRALFDTGSNHALVALAYAKKLGLTDEILAHDPHAISYWTADRAKSVPLHQFDSLTIAFQPFQHPRLPIIEIPVVEADMVLGEDFMRTRRFWLSYATHTLYMQPTSAQ